MDNPSNTGSALRNPISRRKKPGRMHRGDTMVHLEREKVGIENARPKRAIEKKEYFSGPGTSGKKRIERGNKNAGWKGGVHSVGPNR